MTTSTTPTPVCPCGLPANHDPAALCACGHEELDHRMEHDDVCLACPCQAFRGVVA